MSKVDGYRNMGRKYEEVKSPFRDGNKVLLCQIVYKDGIRTGPGKIEYVVGSVASGVGGKNIN
jgi:hypothetical protein